MTISRKIAGGFMWLLWGPFYFGGKTIAWMTGKCFSAAGFCFESMAELAEGEQDSHENFYWMLFGGTAITLCYGSILYIVVRIAWEIYHGQG